MKRLFALSLMIVGATLSVGCADDFDPFDAITRDFDEGVNVADLKGRVVIPQGLGLRKEQVGAIYIGLFSNTIDTGNGYQLPKESPGKGDTFPYAGTMVGIFTATGEPGLDLAPCAMVTHPDELEAGRSTKETVPNAHLAQEPNGDFSAEFEMRQFPFYPGAKLFAFADAPAFSTCNPNSGFNDFDFNEDYGSNYPDILNRLGDRSGNNYIQTGDLVLSEPISIESLSDVEVVLDHVVKVAP